MLISKTVANWLLLHDFR